MVVSRRGFKGTLLRVGKGGSGGSFRRGGVHGGDGVRGGDGFRGAGSDAVARKGVLLRVGTLACLRNAAVICLWRLGLGSWRRSGYIRSGGEGEEGVEDVTGLYPGTPCGILERSK